MYVPDDDNYIVDGENYAPPRPPQENNQKFKLSQNMKIIILIIVVVVLGLSVYFISNLFFNGSNKKQQVTSGLSSTLSIDDSEVQKIYNLVKYGRDSNTLNKYLKEQFVTLKDFSNYEKYYYALSLLQEKNLKEIKSTGDSQKQYFISDNVMDELMKSYFGPKVQYLKQGTIPIVLQLDFDIGNTLSIKYNFGKERYETTVTKTEQTNNQVIPVALYTLESASRTDSGDITLVERVIYVTGSVNNNLVNYQVYRDYNHTMLIDSQSNISLEDYQKDPLTIDEYMENGNIITYKFKENKGEYYFYQSKIEE